MSPSNPNRPVPCGVPRDRQVVGRRILVKCQLGAILALLAVLSVGVEGADPVERATDPDLKKLGAKFVADGWKSSWSPDGKEIVYAGVARIKGDDVSGGVFVLTLETGRTRELVEIGKDPAWSPGKGERIAYVAGGYGAKEEIWIVKVTDGDPKKLAAGGFPSWSPDGKTLFYHSRRLGKLMKIRTDIADAKPVELLQTRWWYPMVSPNDQLVAVREGQEIRVMDVNTGKLVRRLPLPGGRGFLGGWSPCGRYLSYGGYGAHDVIGLWVTDLKTGKASRLSAGSFTMSDWSRDGKRIAFDHRKGAGREIWMIETKAIGNVVTKRPENPTPVDPGQIRNWIGQLSNADFKTRERATKSLITAGSQAEKLLKEAMAGGDFEARVRVKKILAGIALEKLFAPPPSSAPPAP